MSNNIHLLELSTYEAPVITESKRNDWVEYGEDNLYYNHLIDMYTNSTTNNAIINNITRLVYGKGLNATDAQVKPNDYAVMMSLFKKTDVRRLVTDLKLLGQCAMQVIYSKDRKKIVNVHHIPVQLLRPEKCNSEGEIESYYYSDDWSDVKKYKPKRIPAFGYSKEGLEIMMVRPYSVGMKYFALVDYTGGLPYCALEEDISTYLRNEVSTGFSGRSVINFSNGIPSESAMHEIKAKVLNQLSGPTGDKVIISFNNNSESKTTVDAMPVNDAPDLYSTLSEECLRKIMLAHNVTSPLLFGIASSNGFSSNSDELKDSFALFSNMVIKPMQEMLLDAFDEILAYNGISLNLYFKTLKPLEFIEIGVPLDGEELEEETGVELSDINKDLQDFIDLGEEPKEDWLLLDEYEVDYDIDDKENELLYSDIKTELSFKDKLINLVSTGTARPNAKSEQDEVIDGIKFITRYVYAGKTTSKTRKFCKAMMAANKIYRKEDILAMTNKPVNPGFGEFGSDSYSIWLHHGGARCFHRWNKQIYVAFEGTGIDVRSPRARQIAGAKAKKYGYEIRNPKLVSTRPRDTRTKGYSPNNPNTRKYWQ